MTTFASLRNLSLALFTLAATAVAAPQDWVGKQLPDLNVDYLDPKPASGKPAVVEFWATWCPPCRVSIPHLNQLNAKYKDKVTIIGISDEPKATVEKFRKGTPMEYTVALDPKNSLAQKFGIEGIPQAFVVDKSGKIVWQGHPMQLKEAQIEAVLK